MLFLPTKITILTKSSDIFRKNLTFALSNEELLTMKKIQIILSLSLLAGILASCSTKVDLYADYKDIPVVYGLLDATQDTNFIKIVRAFSGSDEASVDATQVALIPDSNNYPGKLDAKIYRYRKGYGNEYTLDGVIELDTMTIHDKDSGAFYFPHQKVYYATSGILPNTNSKTYHYRFEILKGNDTISSETGIVGGDNFKIINSSVSFVSEESINMQKIKFLPADNAVVYNMEMQFRYKETYAGVSKFKTVRYSFGMKNIESLGVDEGFYYINYGENLLFNLLRSAISHNPEGTSYTYDPNKSFKITLAAGGEELYNYIQINLGAGGLSQSIPDYTNINGGYGVFSSRVNIERTAKLSARTQTDLASFPTTETGFTPEDF